MAAFFVSWHCGLFPFTFMQIQLAVNCFILQVLLYKIAALFLYNFVLMFLFLFCLLCIAEFYVLLTLEVDYLQGRSKKSNFTLLISPICCHTNLLFKL